MPVPHQTGTCTAAAAAAAATAAVSTEYREANKARIFPYVSHHTKTPQYAVYTYTHAYTAVTKSTWRSRSEKYQSIKKAAEQNKYNTVLYCNLKQYIMMGPERT